MIRRRAIYRQALDSNAVELLVAGTGSEVTPDAQAFLYFELETATSDSVWLMGRAFAGGASSKVMAVPRALLDAYYCSSNSKATSPCVLGLWEGEKKLVFYSLDPVKGKGLKVGELETGAPDVAWLQSHDGSGVAAVLFHDDPGKIKVASLVNRPLEEISCGANLGHLDGVAWAADDKGFFVTSVMGGVSGVSYVTMNGKVTPLFRSDSFVPYLRNPRPSPDGKHIAFAGQSWDGNVWIAENF